MKEPGYSELAPAAIGPYSQGCRAGDMVFVSGQGPLDPANGRLCSPDIAEQTRQTLTNIQNILKSMHATMQDVVKTTVVLTDMKDFAAMNEVYKEFFSAPYPARICFGGQLIVPGMLVEIDAVAQTDKWHWE